MLLRRAFSIYAVHETRRLRRHRRVHLRRHGQGHRLAGPATPRTTRSTSSVRSADRSRCRRSLSSCVLVGGGYGSAPLFTAGGRPARAGLPGRHRARRSQRRPALRRARRQADGGAASRSPPRTAPSARRAGSPTCCRRSSSRVRAEVIYACGPMPMLKPFAGRRASHDGAMHSPARGRGVDGVRIGVCMTCVLPVRRRRRRDPDACAPASTGRFSTAIRIRWDHRVGQSCPADGR